MQGSRKFMVLRRSFLKLTAHLAAATMCTPTFAQEAALRKIDLLDRNCAFYDNQQANAPLKGLWTGQCTNGLATGRGIVFTIDEQKRSVIAQYHGQIDKGYFSGRGYYARPLVDSGTYEFTNGSAIGSATVYRFSKTGPTSVWQGNYAAGIPQSAGGKITLDTDKAAFEQMFKQSQSAKLDSGGSDPTCDNAKTISDAAESLRRIKISTAYIVIGGPMQVARCLLSIDRNQEAYTYYLQAAEKGNDEAQNLVAVWLETGRNGVKLDTEKAAFWYQKSMAQGNTDAMANYADLIIKQNNTGVKTE
jgi:Sel1 repeat